MIILNQKDIVYSICKFIEDPTDYRNLCLINKTFYNVCKTHFREQIIDRKKEELLIKIRDLKWNGARCPVTLLKSSSIDDLNFHIKLMQRELESIKQEEYIRDIKFMADTVINKIDLPKNNLITLFNDMIQATSEKEIANNLFDYKKSSGEYFLELLGKSLARLNKNKN